MKIAVIWDNLHAAMLNGSLIESRRISALTTTFGVQCFPHVWGTPIALARFEVRP